MRLICILFLSLAVNSVFADHIGLQGDPKGTAIKAGSVGDFILEGPVLALDDKTEHAPAVVAGTDGLNYKLTYNTGFEIEARISKAEKTVTFSFQRVPANGQYLRFSMFVPLSFNQRGKVGLDGSTFKVIPEKQSGQFVVDGREGEFDLMGPFGNGLSIRMPVSWECLQDNRVFNWPIFVWSYNYDMKAFPNQTSVIFSFSSL